MCYSWQKIERFIQNDYIGTCCPNAVWSGQCEGSLRSGVRTSSLSREYSRVVHHFHWYSNSLQSPALNAAHVPTTEFASFSQKPRFEGVNVLRTYIVILAFSVKSWWMKNKKFSLKDICELFLSTRQLQHTRVLKISSLKNVRFCEIYF